MSDSELFVLRKVIKLTLIKIGIRCDLIGFEYLCYSIELAIIEPKRLDKLCEKVYSHVGEHYKVENTHSVERSMRHAIDNGYTHTNFGELIRMYGENVITMDSKPTIGEFIRLIAEFYNLGLYEKHITI